LEKAERIMEVEPFHFSKTVKKGKYKPKFEERRYIGNFTVIPVVAPVDAVPKILNLLASANRSILIQEFYIYKYWGSKEGYKPNLFLEASIDAARRGCNVKILLDSTWYNVFEDDPVSNLNTLKYINEIAEKEDLPIEARLIDFGKTGLRSLHAKGVIVDEKVVFISSVNWNEHSPTKNREIGVIVYGEPAEYYVEVFFADWNRETRWPIFVALALIFVLCVWKLKPHLRRF
jgi:phosphatidylserine/phosphatidylglycerophosphate/cardiolipin synthase-like enzyme